MVVFAALFCDYYNSDDEECDWHYKSCGPACIKTCRNPSGDCSDQIPPLEGYIFTFTFALPVELQNKLDLINLRTYLINVQKAEDLFF